MAQLEEAPYPCPACGSKLYGWTAAHDPIYRSRRIVLDRCESCGLVVTRAPDPPDLAAEVEALVAEAGTGEDAAAVRAPNRRSIQAGLGGAQWAGLEPPPLRLQLNPEALRLLLAKRGWEVGSVRTPFDAQGRGSMVQTMLNAFTLRDNFLRNARAGRLEPRTGRERLLHRLDWLVSVLVWGPAALFGMPLEAIAAALGRGGVIEASARRVRS